MFKNYKLDLYLWFRSSDKHEVNGNNGGFSCIYQDDGWKLDRTNYYQEGWLATGNARGLVGVTFTTSHCRTRATELPLRANYNLRGHRSEVSFVSSRSSIYILFFPSLFFLIHAIVVNTMKVRCSQQSVISFSLYPVSELLKRLIKSVDLFNSWHILTISVETMSACENIDLKCFRVKVASASLSKNQT